MTVSEEQIETTEPATQAQEEPRDEPLAEPGEPVEAASEEPEKLTKRKLEEQLEALKRKEAELRRALVVANYPELADAIRVLQGRTYALERSEAKLALGLTKAELRRRETLQKKRASLEEKRAELDTQIAALDGELLGLGVERQQGYEAEHRHGLEELLVALDEHLGQVQAAGLEVTELLPELKHWLPEIERLASQKTAN
jgi:multidrug resistance efflux pump